MLENDAMEDLAASAGKLISQPYRKLISLNNQP